ncbi:MAG TPA: PAS domain S-box protein [Desulfuromonadales bacterium]|nr:PAS domain S-box protein [Desulfuromonadales bacterium]
MNFSLGKIIAFAYDSIMRKLYLHTIIVAIFLLIVISITIWAGNTLTMITAIARFERTHTVSRVEAMVALLKFHDNKKPEELERFQAKMAITQSYNKVFSRLLEMRKDTSDAEFVRILESTFSETDHNTAEIIVNRIKVLYWHPILKELVANAGSANLVGEKLKAQAAQFIAANNQAERTAIFAEIEKTENKFISYEASFSKSCSDLSRQISSYVNYITMLLLIISVGFTGLLTYLIARSVIQQAAKYTSDLEKEIQVRTLVEETLLSLKDRLQEQNEELQVNEEELRSQNDELLTTEEMLRVQIDEYETSQKLLKEREESLYRQYNLFSTLLNILPIGVFMVEAPSGKPLVANQAASDLLGRGILPDATKENLSNVYKAYKAGTHDPYPPEEMPIILGMKGVTSHIDDMEVERPDGTKTLLEIFGAPVADDKGNIWASLVSFINITNRKRAEEAIHKRILSLTQPAESGTISFDELFDVDDIQRLQDEFARATGVASLITTPDGIPITAPSNFTRLCSEIIRTTEKGCAACFKSDAAIGRYNPDGPNIQPCLSGGLWDAGAGITVGGRHIANWLIGQVRDETQSEESMAAYAREIGADDAGLLEAFRQVPSMSHEHFCEIAQVLFTLANQLSTAAYLNLQQARFINERHQAELELQESQKQYRNLVEGTPDLITRVDMERRLIFVNHAAMKFYGLPPEGCVGRMAFDFIHPDDRESTIAAFNTWIQSGEEVFTHENRQVGIGGPDHYHMVWTIRAERDEKGALTGFASTARDITDSKHNQEEKTRLEAQLQQSQKLESIGRLAGGVAHDFNNMLSVILGHAELGIMKLDSAHPVCADLLEIGKTAERSADLTRQLLAFARKQTITPKTVNLNETVSGMLKMLQRLIGENINLTWQPAANLWQANIDPSQIDQILANLCVNARDAIGNTGRITIETENSTIDEQYCAASPEAVPGEYVRLTVSDTGHGMDRETMSHIFEPFYTTKEMGKGTGLGLATVYGAVKQNNGFIAIYSEQDQGTAISIYLPRQEGVHGELQEAETAVIPRGHETILLVEDEPTILNIASLMLANQGYTVLKAGTPGEATRLAAEHAGEIHLLMTDVIMPELNGRDLAEKLLADQPQMKLLFMSGYTADVIAHHGVLDEGVHFIQKPFTLPVMATMVREVLDRS